MQLKQTAENKSQLGCIRSAGGMGFLRKELIITSDPVKSENF